MNTQKTVNVPPKKAFLRPLMMVVLWPAFIAAALATVVFFSFAEPFSPVLFGEHVAMSAEGAYSLAFFGFWLLGSLSSGMTAFLLYKTH
jgi:hypothetical protein